MGGCAWSDFLPARGFGPPLVNTWPAKPPHLSSELDVSHSLCHIPVIMLLGLHQGLQRKLFGENVCLSPGGKILSY